MSDDQTHPADLSDRELLAAYQRTDGEPGNPVADALVALGITEIFQAIRRDR